MKEKTVRADRLTRVMLVPVAAFFVLYMLLARLTSPLIYAMLLPGMLVFLSSYGMFLLAARKRISRFVRMYVTNCFFLNADESSAKAMRRSLLLGITAALLLFLVSVPFSRLVSGSAKSYSAFRLSLLFFLLHAIQGALYGYVEGAGKRRLLLALDVIRSLLVIVVPVLAGYAGFLYGRKIDALLGTDDCCAAYGALFVFAALLLIDMVFLILLIIIRSFQQSRMRKRKNAKPRYPGEEPAFFKACGQLMAACVLPCFLLALTCFSHAGDVITVSQLVPRFFLIPALTGLLVSFRFTGACYRLPGLSDEIETGGMALRFRRLLHRMSIILPIMTALLFVLSGPLNTALVSYSLNGGANVSMLLAGSFYSAVFCAFVVFCLLLSLTRRRKQMAWLVAGSCVFCAASSVLTMKFTGFGLTGLMVLQVVSLFLFTAGAYVTLCGLIHESRPAFLRMTVKPLFLSVICAMLLYPLQSMLVNVIGEVATCLVCGLSGFVLYLLLMAFFKGFEWGDLMSLPFGRELVRFSLRKRN